jgi:hypothetical protein
MSKAYGLYLASIKHRIGSWIQTERPCVGDLRPLVCLVFAFGGRPTIVDTTREGKGTLPGDEAPCMVRVGSGEN